MALDPSQVAALAQRHVIVAPLLDLYFTSGTVRFALAPWSIAIGGDTYTGIGPIASIGIRTESIVSDEGIEVTASGLDAAVIALALDEPYTGRLLRLRKAILDRDTHAVIGTPQTAFIGRMVSMPITEDNGACTVTIRAEHFDADLARSTPVRLNDTDQQRLHPGDRGCEYVEALVQRKLVWPSIESLKIH